MEAGHAPEIDALVGSVVELGQLTGTPRPHIATTCALTQLLVRSMAEQQGLLRMEPLAA